MIGEWLWCEKCQEPREITDMFHDVIQERAVQRGVHVTQFSCGHSITREDGTYYPFP